jgi:flagellin
MSTINDMVIRIRELVVQAANDTNAHDDANGNMAQSDRIQIQREINELMDEIDATAQRTQFNTRNLIDGNLEAQNSTQFHGFRGMTTSGAGQIGDVTVGMVGGFASGSTALRDGENISTAGAPIWFHVGANFGQGVFLSIEAVNVQALSSVWTGGHLLAATGQLAATMESGFTFAALRNLEFNTDSAGAEAGVMLEQGFEINRFIPAIDFALAHVAGQRANLGAMQNRLEFTIENLDVASENLSAANSRIRDADMAAEMMRFTQSNVLQQAAISMLSQANQAPQSVLSLLR